MQAEVSAARKVYKSGNPISGNSNIFKQKVNISYNINTLIVAGEKMYPESGGADAGPVDYGGDLKSRLGMHLEGFIPLFLVLVIVFFLSVRFDVINSDTPVLGTIVQIFEGQSKPAKMLLIGSSSQQVIDVLNSNPDVVQWRQKTATDLERNPKEQLANYDIVMLDQSQQANKEVSRKLGEAVEDYVNRGGNLIVVLDSGIRRPEAFDVIGWENTFGNAVPVSCDRVVNNEPVCVHKFFVNGKLYREDEDHPVLKGIEIFPADPALFNTFETLDVTPTGREIAYIQDPQTKKTFPAIVEKRALGGLSGKSIYFNYNPGQTRGILESTLDYMR